MVPWKRDVYWTPHDVQEIRGRIRDLFPDGVVTDEGRVSFSVKLATKTRNSFRPTVRGRLAAVAEGTLLELEYPMHPVVFLFVFLHGIPFLGLTWLIGLIGYLMGYKEVHKLVVEQLDIDLEGEPARDRYAVLAPEDPGAASRAPWVFAASTTMDTAVFQVGARRLHVSGSGLKYRDRSFRWDDLASFSTDGTVLVIGSNAETMRLPAKGARPEDVRWLAAYLTARNARWSGTAIQQQAAAKARDQLQGMRGAE